MFIDFEYDGIRLSGLGFVLCEFSSNGGTQTVSNGSKVEFTTAPILRGNHWLLSGTQYKECLTATFSICKSPCLFDNEQLDEITVDEITRLSRWLCRKEFKKFKLLNKDGYEPIFFEGSFEIKRIKLYDKVVGLELTLITNRPFALCETVVKTLNFTSAGQTLVYRDISDEMGFIHVNTTITCNASGDLIIHNALESRDTIIKNCIYGEIITMNYPIISSSVSAHKIQDDFNFNFFRIVNTWDNPTNKITVSLPCKIKFSYNPIRKVGI